MAVDILKNAIQFEANPLPPHRTRIYAGAGWETSAQGSKGIMGRIKKARGTDLDLGGFFTANGQVVRWAGFDTPDPFDNMSAYHLGDNTTGKGPGDDEVIHVDLTRIPPAIDNVVFIVSAFKPGVSFRQVAKVTGRLKDLTTGDEFATFMPPMRSAYSVIVLGRLFRDSDGWREQVIGDLAHGGSSLDTLVELAEQACR